MVKVFVYGILVGWNGLGITAMLKGYTRYMRNGYYDIKVERKGFVIGELLEISEDELSVFDLIEGVDKGFYKRNKVVVSVVNNSNVGD
ncbi:MAG: hypothetical protein DRJ15_17875, partial [Bacteroidetes bacterium]